jgi:hypothetical protein
MLAWTRALTRAARLWKKANAGPAPPSFLVQTNALKNNHEIAFNFCLVN